MTGGLRAARFFACVEHSYNAGRTRHAAFMPADASTSASTPVILVRDVCKTFRTWATPAQRLIAPALHRAGNLLAQTAPRLSNSLHAAAHRRMHVHEALHGSGLMFPLHLGAEGSAQIGGLIGTNAGGSHAFRYGMMGDLVLGVEAVLADGTVWNGLRAVQKDNAGYPLRRRAADGAISASPSAAGFPRRPA